MLFLLVSASYTIWLVKQASAPLINKRVQNQHPDAFMTEFTAIEMDKMGKPHSMLHARNLVHYHFQNTAVLQEPYFILYADNAAPWHIKSQRGRTTHGQERIDLEENVIIQQLNDHNKGQTLLKTSAITVYPKRHYADSTEYVELTEPDLFLQGIGMHAFLKEKRIQLLKEVRGTHAPN